MFFVIITHLALADDGEPVGGGVQLAGGQVQRALGLGHLHALHLRALQRAQRHQAHVAPAPRDHHCARAGLYWGSLSHARNGRKGLPHSIIQTSHFASLYIDVVFNRMYTNAIHIVDFLK